MDLWAPTPIPKKRTSRACDVCRRKKVIYLSMTSKYAPIEGDNLAEANKLGLERYAATVLRNLIIAARDA